MKTTQKEAQHTPTPWIKNFNFVMNDKAIIAICNTIYDQKLDEANAAFIVRAVNSHEALLEALKSCRMQLRIYGDIKQSEVLKNGWIASMKKADEAISRAEAQS